MRKKFFRYNLENMTPVPKTRVSIAVQSNMRMQRTYSNTLPCYPRPTPDGTIYNTSDHCYDIDF